VKKEDILCVTILNNDLFTSRGKGENFKEKRDNKQKK
jgi:hypothetical protein